MIDISIDADDAENELRSLAAWLRNEPGVRQHADIGLAGAPPEPGRMGSSFEILQLVVDSGFQVAGLTVAILAWLGTRRAAPAVIIRCGGTEIQLPGAAPEDVAALVKALESPDRE